MRKDSLVTGEVYHIFTRSIAEFTIFNNESEFLRMLEVIRYYQREKPQIRFSEFMLLEPATRDNKKEYLAKKDKLVEVIAYCLMPTHVHLILKEFKKRGISIFMNNILNSYTRYFNSKHKRKGPLWETRFKNVLVETDEYLLHLTRYVHLNPVTALLANQPENWKFSSYQDYISTAQKEDKLCKFDDILNINPHTYRTFVEDRISHQRELAKIKSLLLD